MIEILVTSFPFVLRVIYLRWRGMPITLYNVHRALVLWFALAVAVFFAVFYYYPKSYTGLVPFRTVPVVAESGGTVSEVYVKGGDKVALGDPLFSVEDAAQRASVAIAGWQQMKMSRRRSSSIGSGNSRSSAVISDVLSASSIKRASLCLRRTRSMMMRLPATMSHAPTLSGGSLS